jgi:nucleotide-binding universal stress UspA family protein
LKIVIPTDFSPQAEFALILARKLAQNLPVHLDLLHVIPCRTEARVSADGSVEVEEDSVQGYLQAQYQAALKGFEMYDTTAFAGVETHVEFAPLSEAITHLAADLNADLIIMGTKGAFGLKQIVSGSATQHVVRQSEIPVLSLMCDRSDLEIKDVLLVHNVLDKEAKLPPAILALVKAYGATLHILQHEGSEELASTEAGFQHFIEREGLEKVKTHIYQDKINERAIVSFNQMKNMDLIVVGTENRKGLSQILRPSLAEKLVQHLYKPVITYQL